MKRLLAFMFIFLVSGGCLFACDDRDAAGERHGVLQSDGVEEESFQNKERAEQAAMRSTQSAVQDEQAILQGEQPEPEDREDSIFKSRFRAFIDDGAYLFSFPKRTNRKGLAATTIFLLSTAGFVHFDEDLRDAVQRNRGETIESVADFFEPLGKAEINFAECGLLYLAARIFDDDYLRETSVMALESLIYTGLITSTSKVMFGREGPSSGKQWGSFFNGSDLFP